MTFEGQCWNRKCLGVSSGFSRSGLTCFFVGILLFAHFIVHGLLYMCSPAVLYCLHLLHSTEMSHLLYIISICTPSLFLTYLRRFVTTSVSLSLLNYSSSAPLEFHLAFIKCTSSIISSKFKVYFCIFVIKPFQTASSNN